MPVAQNVCLVNKGSNAAILQRLSFLTYHILCAGSGFRDSGMVYADNLLRGKYSPQGCYDHRQLAIGMMGRQMPVMTPLDLHSQAAE